MLTLKQSITYTLIYIYSALYNVTPPPPPIWVWQAISTAWNTTLYILYILGFVWYIFTPAWRERCRKQKHSTIFLELKGQERDSVNQTNGGAGIAQWLERRTRDWKVTGSNPCWNGGRIFFSRVDFLCWLLFRYPFHPRVTTVARKKIPVILPKVQVAGYS